MLRRAVSWARARRKPEKVMTLGMPWAAEASMLFLRAAMHSSCSSGWAKPLAKPWLPAMAQVSPCFLRVSQCSGPTSSTEATPMEAAAAARVSTDMGLKHQWTTDWRMRPLEIL